MLHLSTTVNVDLALELLECGVADAQTALERQVEVGDEKITSATQMVRGMTAGDRQLPATPIS
ncbi:MAG TPA: hypothetical protein VJN70_21045 [Gemmatimonadaceae bacterium]|nr:hypothetical protein [Gemmatimonadaceae bacterium]